MWGADERVAIVANLGADTVHRLGHVVGGVPGHVFARRVAEQAAP